MSSEEVSWRGYCLVRALGRSQVKWLTPVVLATQEMEIGRIVVQGQPRLKVCETPSQPIKN
jgi:hypothetical protein